MNTMDMHYKQKFIFGRLFILSNKLQTIGDHVLADEMTIRQWLLTVAIAQFPDAPPTLREVAELMGSSHQNVKQLALKLQKKGFLDIEKDEQDLRAIRLILTAKSGSFWNRRQSEVRNFLTDLFTDVSSEEIDSLYHCLNKLYEGALKMEKSL